MSDRKNPVGTIAWRDLTVADAEGLRDFYAAVVGWQASAQDMGGYSDFNMTTADGRAVAGICHARGSNANLPPQWLIYVHVEDVDGSAARCRDLGGSIVDGPRAVGSGRFCVIRDPAGAFMALYSD